jgi:hypothetical protein
MGGNLQKLRAMGINMNKIKQENKHILFGRLEGWRITKGWFLGVFWQEKQKKGKSFCRLEGLTIGG